MKTFPPKIVFGLILLMTLFSGCGSDPANKSVNSSSSNAQSENTGNASLIKDNLDDFKEIVKLSFEPEDVIWREENGNSSGSGKKLTAIIKSKPADTEKIVAQAAGIGGAKPAYIETETWFPDEIIARSQISGDETVKGTEYSANDFLQPPYTGGKLTHIENSDFFMLELTGK